METFVSEPITPQRGTFDPVAMARGEPGLPRQFDWRGVSYAIVAKVATWKQSAVEGGRPGGERYLRRHYFKLRMSDASTWTVYFTRQAAQGGSARQRWFLLTVARA